MSLKSVFVSFHCLLCLTLGGMSAWSIQAEERIPATESGMQAPDAKVFKNEFRLSLKPGVNESQIKSIKDPFVRNLATQLLRKTFRAHERYLVAEPYEPVDDLAKRLKTSPYSRFENPTGIYFEAGEEAVLVVGDTKGEKIELIVHDFGRDGGHSSYELHQGINIIPVTNSGLGYISYYTPNADKAPKVKISVLSGKVNGCFVRGKHTNKEWSQMLENASTEVIDIVGKHVHLVFPVQELKEFCPNRGEDLIALYDQIIDTEQQTMGLKLERKQPRNRMFGRVIWNGFMHADGIGAAFNNGTMRDLADPDKIPSQSWGIAHEFGHVNQVRPSMMWVSTTEVTNNIYSAFVNYLLNPKFMRLEHEAINGGDGHMIGGRYNAYLNSALINKEHWLKQSGPDTRPGGGDRPMVYDHFVKLGPLWQLALYFDLAGQGKGGFYPEIFRRAMQADDKGKSNGELQLVFMKNACDVTRCDLSDFFKKTGMLQPIDEVLDDYRCDRMTITEAECRELEKYAKRYKKPLSPVIEYISVNSLEAFKNRLPVKGIFDKGITPKGQNMSVSHDVWKNVVVFETYNGKDLVKVTMVGTDSPDNSSTTVIYPPGSTRIEAVSWNGERTLVYGTRP